MPYPQWLSRKATAFAALLVACSGGSTSTVTVTPGSFARNPCNPAATVQLDATQSVLMDCTNGGTTVTLAGHGASYLVVPQFPTNSVANLPVSYTLATGSLTASIASTDRAAARLKAQVPAFVTAAGVPPHRPEQRQFQFEQMVFARARASRAANPLAALSPTPRPAFSAPPTLGSTRTFH